MVMTHFSRVLKFFRHCSRWRTRKRSPILWHIETALQGRVDISTHLLYSRRLKRDIDILRSDLSWGAGPLPSSSNRTGSLDATPRCSSSLDLGLTASPILIAPLVRFLFILPTASSTVSLKPVWYIADIISRMENTIIEIESLFDWSVCFWICILEFKTSSTVCNQLTRYLYFSHF